MKKDMIFAPAMIVVAVLLCLLKATGMAVHIAVSVVGIAVLIAYTVQTKKDWKIPALEIIMRACYGIALLTGVALMKVAGVAALPIVHKVCAAVFTVLFIVLFVMKLRGAKKA